MPLCWHASIVLVEKYGQNDVTAVRKKAGRRQAGRTKKRRAGLTNGVRTG